MKEPTTEDLERIRKRFKDVPEELPKGSVSYRGLWLILENERKAVRSIVRRAILEQSRTEAEFDPDAGELVVMTRFESDDLEETFTKETRCRMPGYRGVWQKSGRYLRGDQVTRDGALWHCCSSETIQKPGTGDGWQLMHKSERIEG